MPAFPTLQPQSRGGPPRSVRCSDEIWDAAKARAEQEGLSMSHVVQTFIEGYVSGQLSLPQVSVRWPPTRVD